MEKRKLYEVTIFGSPCPFIIKDLETGQQYKNIVPEKKRKEKVEFLNEHTIFLAPNLYDCPENRRGHYEWAKDIFGFLTPAFIWSELDSLKLESEENEWPVIP